MKYLGLDLGKKSLGIAISDKLGIIASFYKNIKSNDENELLMIVDEIVSKEKIDEIVLGYPKNMDNSEGFRAKETISFKEKLEDRVSIPVNLQDERLSTREAENILIGADMSRKKRKSVIDGVSAVIILQSFLDRKD